ncbi:hypothetical protein HELRODRAFT_164405 [Helobdella robusta]|uniref:EDR1/CTR1/ARMC3-like peptidase-like domain-containing protein n=1 Tax=Helobdella robusta TaxID=6412 RepID=T1EVD9_HELRO|nr:hypothetical protein HELRODRAFT_164405 [Helobdella robusta]ESN94547.1 hypothetical protein HELRODRAFT_164405 [Helobdella robusta]
MAVDWTSKVKICCCGGLLPLFQHLSSQDPDVVTNSLHVVALMLQDYDVKKSLYACNTLMNICPFLHSKFVFQQNGCEIQSKLIEYAKNSSKSKELIPYAVDVLSKSLHVQSAVQRFVELGGLDLLETCLKEDATTAAAASNEVLPTEETSKKGKKEKLPPVAPKNIKKQKEEEVPVEIVDKRDNVFIECTLIQSTAKCLSSIVLQADMFRLWHSRNMETLVINHLQNVETAHAPTQAALIEILALMCLYEMSLRVIEKAERNGVSKLVEILKISKDEQSLYNAACCVCNLSCVVESRQELIRLDVVPRLVDILFSQCIVNSSAPASKEAVAVMKESEQSGENYKLSFTDSAYLVGEVILALSLLTVDQQARQQFLNSGRLVNILSMLHSYDGRLQRRASIFVWRLAHHENIAKEIILNRGLHSLFAIDQSLKRRNAYNKLALDQLFKHNLVVKFAYTGVLDYKDRIADGFYDPGQMKPCTFECFKSLEQHQNEDFQLFDNTYRLTNSQTLVAGDADQTKKSRLSSSPTKNKTNKKQTTTASKQQQQQTSKINNTNDDLELKDDTTSLSNASHSSSDHNKPTVIFEDFELQEFIEKCKAEVLALQTTKHQIVQLAKLVSARMGGQMMKQHVKDFQWAEHMDQLKKQLNSNLLPLGKIMYGINHHRALLFKAKINTQLDQVIADRLNIQCKLERRDYNLSYVEGRCVRTEQLRNVKYLVDLMHQPGHLMTSGSSQALAYSSI